MIMKERRICFSTNNLASFLLKELSKAYKVKEEEILQSALDLLLRDAEYRYRILDLIFRAREMGIWRDGNS
jgi:hypothetical protein